MTQENPQPADDPPANDGGCSQDRSRDWFKKRYETLWREHQELQRDYASVISGSLETNKSKHDTSVAYLLSLIDASLTVLKLMQRIDDQTKD